MPDLENVTNQQIEQAVDTWIHNETDRIILKYRLCDGYTYSRICDKLYAEHKIVLTERQIANRLRKAEFILFKHI